MTKQATRGSASRRPSTGPTGPRWKLWGGAATLVAVGLVAAVVFAGGGSDTSTTPVLQATPSGNAVDATADSGVDFALPNFEGETVRLSDFRGQGVIVNYWASWCLPCLAELPRFEEVYQRNRGTVAFLGVNLADDPSSALSVIGKAGVTYPLAVDADGATFTAFGAYTMPTTVFISPDGEVLEVYGGPLTAEELEARIKTYFGA